MNHRHRIMGSRTGKIGLGNLPGQIPHTILYLYNEYHYLAAAGGATYFMYLRTPVLLALQPQSFEQAHSEQIHGYPGTRISVAAPTHLSSRHTTSGLH